MLKLYGKQNKVLIVEGNTINIRKLAWGLAAERNRTLPIRNITSVEVKKPGAVWLGFIQFSIAGGKVNDSSLKISGGSFDAAADENSILFSEDEAYKTALKIKEYVENYIEPQSNMVPQQSPADEIAKFKKLFDEGILTESEFLSKKKQLLNI